MGAFFLVDDADEADALSMDLLGDESESTMRMAGSVVVAREISF